MSSGNPPPIKLPNVADKALFAFLKQLKDALYLLWYQVGVGTGVIPITSGGTGAESASDARTSLGVAIGSDVQAYDAGLQSISGLTTAADRMIYTTASDTYAVSVLTTQARNLLDDTTAADMRTTLGLGTIATQNANNVSISGGSISGVSAASVTLTGSAVDSTPVGGSTPDTGTFTTLACSVDFVTGKTITAPATTGAQTIDKTAGSVNFAAAATSLVVTNSLVDADSVILATVATNDTTLKSVQAVAGSGAFTLYANAAATGETRVNFLVTN